MEATEKSVSEQHEQIKDEYLTELQRKVLNILRELNVHRYCPPATQIAQRADLDVKTVKSTMIELCRLRLVVLRIDSTDKETYRICHPVEYMKKDRFVIDNGGPVSPKPDMSSTGTVSPKVQPTVQPKVLSCPKCDFVTKSYAGLHIHVGQKHKTAADIRDKIKLQELKAKKKVMRSPPDPPANAVPLVTIVLTADEALEAGVALALADMINADRFKDAYKISQKILRAIAKQIPWHDIEEAS